MFSIKPTGQERVSFHLTKALKCIQKLKALSKLNPTKSNKKMIESNLKRIQLTKKKLVFLSAHSRDKVTRFYASNALKEIAQKI